MGGVSALLQSETFGSAQYWRNNMAEYINLNPVIREISDVQNNILLLNGKIFDKN